MIHTVRLVWQTRPGSDLECLYIWNRRLREKIAHRGLDGFHTTTVQGYSPHLKELPSHEHSIDFIKSFNDQRAPTVACEAFCVGWMLVGQRSRIHRDWLVEIDTINNVELTEGLC